MNKKFYIESFPYEIELTARICHESARRLLDSYSKDISIDEFSVLDTIVARPGLSQADLARLVLKGKAHTGRFIMSLEDKGLVERHVEERDGKLIKVAVITEKGQELYQDVLQTMRPAIEHFESVVPEKDIKKMVKELREFRKRIEEVNKIVFE